jgi:aspartate aminotransferase
MTIARKIESFFTRSSWIRKMFEEGLRLKAQHGADKVFDFSLGNPNLPPPEQFSKVLLETVSSCGLGDHCYMPNTGYPYVCTSIADFLKVEQGVDVGADGVLMTCGAAGALNVILKTLLDPGDEVLVPSPYFVDYGFYIDNHGGVMRTVATRPDFTLDVPAMEAAISQRTKAVLINSPNNPTGQVYGETALVALAEALTRRGRELGRTIYLLSDEPYRKIVYDGVRVPSILAIYPESIIATSYSKDISIPGERLGFLAVSPRATYRKELLAGCTMANRILGFINAPALMQRVVCSLQGLSVDIAQYQRKRDLLCDGLREAGYAVTPPPGAFYLFPKAPIADDVAFVRALQEELILTVPGSGFGAPGFFRIAYCVADATITGAMPGFKRVLQRITG